MPELETTLKAKVFDSAFDLVEFIRPSSKNWGETLTDRFHWVFRGHGNAEWSLLPSALRAGNMLSTSKPSFLEVKYWFENAPNKGKDTLIGKKLAAQHLAEAMILLNFNNLCDDLGFPRLQTSALRIKPRLVDAIAGKEKFIWEPSLCHAIAQHHGIPTRLLDWSQDPLVAAFFAARDAISLMRSGHQVGSLCIWAFDSWSIPPHQGLVNTFYIDNSHSTFVHAQRGIFTWVNCDHVFENEGKWMTLDEAVIIDLQSFNERKTSREFSPSKWYEISRVELHDVIRKFILPASQAKELLRILSREKRLLAHLMPTLDNVATTITEQWIYEDL